MDRVPHKIRDQMHTVHWTATKDHEIILIFKNVERTAEKWDDAKKILGLKSGQRLQEKNEYSKKRSDSKMR